MNRKGRIITTIVISLLVTQAAYSQSTAGAIFLLIAPGARAGGMGEAQVAVANDAYASYWNPAGLAFQTGYEMSGMHVKWLPGLADDMAYDFLAYRQNVKNFGSIGGHLIYLDAGEQIRTDSEGNTEGTFRTYFTAAAISYSALLTRTSGIGLNAKILYQHLADRAVGTEQGNPWSTDFGFDVGYLKRNAFNGLLDFGSVLTNIGPKISFIDEDQADPMPTTFKLGVNIHLIKKKHNSLDLAYDVSKIVVASYAAMDWDGDGWVGGYNSSGSGSFINGQPKFNAGDDYNQKGQQETPHTDPWYVALFTSWVDDWLLGGNRDMDNPGDRRIGGYDQNGNPTFFTWDVSSGDSVMVITQNYGDPEYGVYGRDGRLEVGNKNNRSIQNELNTLVNNVGVEYWYNDLFAIRGGWYRDVTGKISAPTFGFGIRYGNFGFDFGYTSEKPNHPLNNTMRYSLTYKF